MYHTNITFLIEGGCWSRLCNKHSSKHINATLCIDCQMPEYAQIDVSASIENMLLKIDELGLGAVWLGIAPLQERMEAVKDVLNLPEELEAFAIIPCGYPAEERVQQDRFEESRVHYVD